MDPGMSWYVHDTTELRERLQVLGLPAALLDNHWHVPEVADDSVRIVELSDDQIQLRSSDRDLGRPVMVDFLHGKTGFRAQRFAHEMIVKAVAGRGKDPLSVVDATAGLGRDGFLLAAAGHSVTLVERHPAVAILLADGLYRAGRDPEMVTICSRLRLVVGSAQLTLAAIPEAELPDVVYLDPMFPERQKSALVKKEMRMFRGVVGDDEDATELLMVALQVARKRVVVKRPRKAEVIGERKPSHQLTGTSSRFDVYAL